MRIVTRCGPGSRGRLISFSLARSFAAPLFALLVWSNSTLAQTLTVTNGVQTYVALTNTTVTMSNRCELRVTDPANPIPGSLIDLNSTDSFFVLQNIRPSTVVATFLSQVRINGANAVADSNCRVVQYGVGSVVVPHAAAFQPLQVFSGPHFTGASASLGQYVYYKGTGLGGLNATISSFKLKRGYMATLAQNENGSGISKCYIAQDGDMDVSVLPARFDNSIRFVYVLPWRWSSKKGIAGNIEGGLNVNWKYDWNIDQNSTRDLEYVAIRQTRYWPGLSQNWQSRGVNQLLGYNEPDKADQANIPIADALSSWPDLLATGLRIGSPAPSDGGRSSWLYPFIQQADASDLRVDFVPLHYYWCFNPADPAGAANQMYGFLKSAYDQVKRPLWVTEWNNGANWTTCGDPTFAQQQAAVAAMVAMLDSTPFVERYALYNWVEDVRRVRWDDGSLTSAGVTYRDEPTPMGYVQALQDNATRSFTQLRFEDNTLDTSGYGNNGIPSGSPAYTNGHSGDAIVFDGANTVVTLPPNVACSNGFTFAAWVYWNGGGNWQRIFDFGNSTTHFMFLTPSSGNGTLRFAIANGGSEQRVETTGLAANQWMHVAVALSGNTARLYVNGALAASNTGMSITPASFKPRVNFLGKSQFVADPLFKGLMDDVLITDYAMSAAQVAGLQTNSPPAFIGTIFPRGSATEAQSYSNSIAGTGVDPDLGDSLVYSKAVGPAWLNIAADGTLTGSPTGGDGGTNYFTIRVTDAAGQNAFALVTISVTTVTASGIWSADTSANWSESNRWSGNIVATGPSQTADFSTINISANRTVTLDSSRSIGALKFGDTSGSQSWTLTNSGDSILTLDNGPSTQPLINVTNTANLGVSLGGGNGFVKNGPGTLILSGNNLLSGVINLDRGADGSTLSDGAVRVTTSAALAGATQLAIRNTSVTTGGGRLELDGSTGDIFISQDLTTSMRNNTTGNLRNIAGSNVFAGNIWCMIGGSNAVFQSDAGTLILSGDIRYVGSSTNARAFNFLGSGNVTVVGNILNSTNGALVSLAKSGTGALSLNGDVLCTGTTTVSAGTLLVNGTLPSSPLTMANNTTLGGAGIIGKTVTIPAGGTLAPGAGVGALIVNNNVTLQPGSITRIELDKSAGTNDLLSVAGLLSYGGSLMVTNLGGTLWAGDSFQIFSATSATGSFSATNLPPLPNGFTWEWSPSSGTLAIVSSVALNPTNLTANFLPDTLQLSWPDDHIGWRIETNAVDITDPNSWFTLNGSSTTNQVFLPINPASSQVFFRIVFP